MTMTQEELEDEQMGRSGDYMPGEPVQLPEVRYRPPVIVGGGGLFPPRPIDLPEETSLVPIRPTPPGITVPDTPGEFEIPFIGDIPFIGPIIEDLVGDITAGPPPLDELETYFPLLPDPGGGPSAISEIGGAIGGAIIGAVGGPALGVGGGMVIEGILEDYFEGGPPEVDTAQYGAPGAPGPVGELPMPNGHPLVPPGSLFVYIRTNRQTGLRYGKTVDGRMVYEQGARRGGVTVHRPRKPVVLYPGRISISQAARAARRLDTVARQIKSTALGRWFTATPKKRRT